MYRKCFLQIFTLSTLIFSTLSLACSSSEYESCWRVDLGPLGEAKDCKCLPKLEGDIAKGVEDAKKETNKFINNLAAEIHKTPEAIHQCFSNLSQCANEIISAPLALPVQAYIDRLYRQSEGKSFGFSEKFIALAQPYYDYDLSVITYADDIDTGSEMTVAYCDRVFFAGHGDLWKNKNELHHVLHELEHIGQCQKRGMRTYLAEYVLKSGVDIVKTGRLNVHDINDYEVAAEAKANTLTDILWNRIISMSSSGVPINNQLCPTGEIFMSTLGGACCTSNYSRCKNLSSGVVTCGFFGC